jgi:hypothetical protein
VVASLVVASVVGASVMGDACAGARDDALCRCRRLRQQRGQHQALRYRQPGRCLAGQPRGRGADALEFALVAQQVEVGLEDLRFGPMPFERLCCAYLRQLVEPGVDPDPSAALLQQRRQLHRDGAGATVLMAQQLIAHRSEYAVPFDAAVLPEVTILAIDNSGHQRWRYLG